MAGRRDNRPPRTGKPARLQTASASTVQTDLPEPQTVIDDAPSVADVGAAGSTSAEPDNLLGDAAPVAPADVISPDGATQLLKNDGVRTDASAVETAGELEPSEEVPQSLSTEAAAPQIDEAAASAQAVREADTIPAEVSHATNIVPFPIRQEDRPAVSTLEWFEPFPFTRSLARMNRVWWAYLRSEGEARQIFLQAFSQARMPADIIDLQTREMNRALDAAISLHRVLAAQMPWFPAGAPWPLRGAA